MAFIESSMKVGSGWLSSKAFRKQDCSVKAFQKASKLRQYYVSRQNRVCWGSFLSKKTLTFRWALLAQHLPPCLERLFNCWDDHWPWSTTKLHECVQYIVWGMNWIQFFFILSSHSTRKNSQHKTIFLEWEPPFWSVMFHISNFRFGRKPFARLTDSSNGDDKVRDHLSSKRYFVKSEWSIIVWPCSICSHSLPL